MNIIKLDIRNTELGIEMKEKYNENIYPCHLRTRWAVDTETNQELCFVCHIGRQEQTFMEWVAKDTYNLYINGIFVCYGPARAAKGYARPDRMCLDPYLTEESNRIEIYVQSDQTDLLCHTKEHPYFGAEISVGGQVIKDTTGFECYLMQDKLKKVERMSSQRGFLEIYRLHGNREYKKGIRQEKMQDVTPPALLWRRVSYAQNRRCPAKLIRRGDVRIQNDRIWENDLTALLDDGYKMGGYPRKDCECILSEELLHFSFDEGIEAGGLHGYIYQYPRVLCGKFCIRIRTEYPVSIWVTYDDLLTDGAVQFNREHIIHGLKWMLDPGEYTLYSQEVYTAQYVQIVADQDIGLTEVSMIQIENPDARQPAVSWQDEDLQAIVCASQNTFVQNAYDIYTDCPSRERAGWLCDSYFLGKAEHFFTGKNVVEKNFLENYLLYENEIFAHKGIMPMCYPAHLDRDDYIPNWILWYLIELEDYEKRTGDTDFIQLHRERIRDILDYFRQCENEFGMLEHMDGWVFVEWSKASDYVEGVNFPTNMLYVRALRAAGNILSDRTLLIKADCLAENIRKMSFDGEVYVDHAIRVDGRLVLTDHVSELCQIFAAYFGIEPPGGQFYTDFTERFARIWSKKDMAPTALFIGGILRLMTLYDLGEYERVLTESKENFLEMAKRTGTIWEFYDESASCNHGFGSILGLLICRSAEAIQKEENRHAT